MLNFYQHLTEAAGSGQRFALGIICGIKGSSPQKKGAKAIFFEDGRIIGTLGGGCLEAEVQDRARRAILANRPASFDLVLDHDFGWDDGLICGGKVCGLILPGAGERTALWRELARRNRPVHWGVDSAFQIVTRNAATSTTEWLYEELVTAPLELWIAGSGHVAQAVTPLAQQVDFAVTVFDDRPALACHLYFPKETRFRVGEWDEILAEPFPERGAFGLIVTRGHQRDAFALARWIQRPFGFLGMIGSQRKRRIIFEQLLQDGIATERQLGRVACPVGIHIESTTVPEIAISIVAQLIERRAKLGGEAPATELQAQGRREPLVAAGCR